MKIHRLQIKNVKGIKSIDIKPKTNLIFITGKNGNGKSSLLDSILYCLAGGKQIPKLPVRYGESNAEIKIELDDFNVSRTFTDSGKTYLKITTKEGKNYLKAQTMLDDISNILYFDPLKFLSEKPAKQKEILLDALGINLNDLIEKFDIVHEERKFVNREKKAAEVTFNSLDIPVNPFLEKVIVSDLVDKRDKIASQLNRLEIDYLQYSDIEGKISEYTKNLEALRNNLDLLDKKIKDSNPDKLLSELNAISTQLSESAAINKEVDNNLVYKNAKHTFSEKKKSYDLLSNELKAISQAKTLRLRNSNLPAEINVTGSNLVYNNIPFSQLSSAEGLKVCLDITNLIKTKMKIIRILDGSLLDEHSLDQIQIFAIKNDMQIWVEIVENKDSGLGFFIESGEIKEKK